MDNLFKLINEADPTYIYLYLLLFCHGADPLSIYRKYNRYMVLSNTYITDLIICATLKIYSKV